MAFGGGFLKCAKFATFAAGTMKELRDLFRLLDTPAKIVILTHARPDGDAIGSSLGLAHYLRKKGHTADIIAPDDFPAFLDWMPGSKDIYLYQKKPKTCFAILTGAEIIFYLDFNSLHRIEDLAAQLQKLRHPFVSVLIDHHREPDAFTDYALWDESACSTSELIFDFIAMAGGEAEIDSDIAACLYTGILTDTGSFQYSNTTPRSHRIAGRLMETGIDIETIHNAVYNQYGENRLRFIGFLLSEKLEVIPEYRTAYMAITMAEAERFKLTIGDKEGVVNLPLAMKQVDFAVLFTEDRDRIKISFRSKGEVHADLFARRYFNGGGHKNASGGSSRMKLEETIGAFRISLGEFFTQNETDEIIQ